MTAARPPAWIVVLDHTYLARTLTDRGRTYLDLASQLADTGALVVASWEPDNQQDSLEAWLSDWAVPYEELYMRATADPKSPAAFFRDTYLTHLRWRYSITAALDDSPTPATHWLNLGIQTIHINAA